MTWDSDDDVHHPINMAAEVWSETGFYTGMVYNGKIVDVLYACTGQYIDGKLAVTFPDANITLAWDVYAAHPGAVRHELSHLFNCPECGGYPESCVMHQPHALMLTPQLNWCPNCEAIINNNKFKYGAPISISAEGHGTTVPAPGTYTYGYGSSVSVTADPDDNYVFDYWILDGVEKYSNPISVEMDSDHTLEAYFESSGGGGGGGGWYWVPV